MTRWTLSLSLVGLGACVTPAVADDVTAPSDTASRDAVVTEDALAQDTLSEASALDAQPGDVAGSTDVLAEDAAPEPESYRYDIDGDGRMDSDFSLQMCSSGSGTCLRVRSSRVTPREIVLGADAPRCSGTYVGSSLRLIGSHSGSALPEVAVGHCADQGARVTPPMLSVIDVDAGTVIAQVTAPSTHVHAWSDDVGNGPLRYPVLAPSYGDGDLSGAYGTAIWGRMCILRVGAPASGGCPAGWIAANTTLPSQPSWFREVGGYLQDADNDGWTDVTLTYHSVAHTVSGRTGAVLNTLVYDVAAGMSPVGFHSGRNYGTHAASRGTDGMLRTTIVAGAPVGTFADYNCNVSRFIAVLDSREGQPGTRRLAWSRYMGFASTNFIGPFTSEFAANPESRVARPADVMDQCVHRFGDSRTVIDGVDAIVVNYFRQESPVDRCLSLQYQLYVPPAWTEAKSTAWYSCFARNVASRGVWGMLALRERDGVSVTGGLEVYVWGQHSTLTPSGETLYIVESLPGAGAFDLRDRASTPMRVYALVRGLFADRGTFARAGRPRIAQVQARGTVGMGAWSYVAELETRDVDGDGLADVHMSDDSWEGFDRARGAWVIK
ncbi:MAG: hypothetical protein Q8Q09_06295 [Deltaproteobacteria bacterium]|nr:hypothetical protein [Deltaproteobacteria bacterium]